MRQAPWSLSLSAVLLLVACGPSVTADSAGAKTAGAKTTSGDNEVVATVDGVDIRRADLDARAKDRLLAIRQQEYELRRQVLDEIITEKLVEKEAKARGVTSQDLVKAEVDDKIVGASDAEITALYEGARERLGGKTKEQVRPEIERYLRQQKEVSQRAQFEEGLRGRAKVKVALAAPRVEFVVPAGEPSLGPDKAPITIVEFADYQCPYCHRAQDTVDELIAKYGTKVRFVHQDFPLENHPRAFFASRGSRCAGDQGKFWEYHRGLLKSPSDFSDTDLAKRATDLGLDSGTFNTCMSSDRHDKAIKLAHETGKTLGVTGTPTFFVNGRVLSGARPRQQFESIIDEELAALPN